MSNYYVILGILPHATADEVRQAYVGLAKKYHPDKNKSPDATRRMAEINLAYETLCDSARRREYDLEHHTMALAAGAGNIQADIPAQHYQVYRQEGEEQGQGDDSQNAEPSDSQLYVAVCSGCGFIRSGGDRSCSQCGMPFSRAKCSQCNFFNNSGIFVCSTCGYAFDPAGSKGRRKEADFSDGDDAGYEPDIPEQGASSEVIRCPQCDEINAYDSGTCWHCKLQF